MENEVPTLQDLWCIYLEYTKITDSTEKQYTCLIRKYLSDWLDLPVSEIDGRKCKERHKEITESGKEVTANRVMQVLGTLYRKGIVYYSEMNPDLVIRNPTCWLSLMRAYNKETPSLDDYIPEHQIKPWWQAVGEAKNDITRDYLRFLLLTGMRKSEAAQIEWKNVDLQSALITLDGRNNKKKRPLTLPLSPLIISILNERREQAVNEFVFPCGIYNHRDSKRRYLVDPYYTVKTIRKRTGIGFTLHDLRRTFTNLAWSLDCLPDEQLRMSIKSILTHVDGAADTLTTHYMKQNPKRLRPVIDGVSALVSRLITPEPPRFHVIEGSKQISEQQQQQQPEMRIFTQLRLIDSES